MVEFNRFMSIGMEKCAPEGPGTGPNRQATFKILVELWNREKDDIEEMTEAELREDLRCP